MADPDQIEDFSQIKIERDYPIVTQPWVTPYKPAAKPLPATWKNLIATATPSNNATNNASTNSSKLLYDQDFFSNQQNQQRRGQQNNSNSKNNLLGGAQFRPGNDGLNGTMSQKNALATTPQNSAHHNNNNATFGTGGFNAFASAARNADGGKGLFVTDENAEELLRNNTNHPQHGTSRFGGGGGGMMLGSGLQRLSTMNDESDEYDERLDLIKHNLRTRDGAPPHHRRHHHPKTREEKEAIREDFRQKREEGYNSGGDLDEGCVGALGEDDEYRAERLKFTTGASHEDGTFKSPYHAAIDHYQKRGGESRSAMMKTPNSAAKLKKQATANPLDYTSSSPAPGGSSSTPKPQQQLFKPSGLRTPQFDPTANLPGPVARHQRRHHHHLLRLLHHPGKPESHHNHNHDGNGDQFHLFPPHEIPTSQIDEERKKNPFNPDTWMLGDATVDDVMNRHFLKK